MFVHRWVTWLYFNRIIIVALKVKCEGKIQKGSKTLTEIIIYSLFNAYLLHPSHTFCFYRINPSLNMQWSFRFWCVCTHFFFFFPVYSLLDCKSLSLSLSFFFKIKRIYWYLQEVITYMSFPFTRSMLW